MRLYSFVMGNYLNAGQHGIQTGHAAVDLTLQDNCIAKEWARHHKTFIILNARNYAGLREVSALLTTYISSYNKVSADEDEIPFTSFYEDKNSLNNIQTCFACILPESFYDDKHHDYIMNNQTVCRDLIKSLIKEYNLVQL